MSELKRTMRDTSADAKEAWRGVDGESLGDKVANAGDRARNAVENAGDDLHENADKASNDVSYERGRADEATNRIDDTGV
jgi:hypothetical protein